MSQPRYTKEFEDWWDAGYGLMDDAWPFEGYQRSKLKDIAYRAYKRGKTDQKKKHKKEIEKLSEKSQNPYEQPIWRS